MKQGPLAYLGRTLAVCLLSALAAAAQEPAASLSLRLTVFEGAPPIYSSVADHGVDEGRRVLASEKHARIHAGN